MRTIALICLITFSILLFNSRETFCQATRDTVVPEMAGGSNSADSINYLEELLFIGAVMQMAHRNTSEMIKFKPEIFPVPDQVTAVNELKSFYYAIGTPKNSGWSVIMEYSKIVGSKSKNPDYKSLSKKYADKPNFGDNWGGLLYDLIYIGSSNSHFTKP